MRAMADSETARSEVFDASARVTPLATPGASIPVSQLLP